MGRVVQMAHDELAALEAGRLRAADVVALDISMPGVDGIEVARRLARIGNSLNPASSH